ncbi:phosphate ABC transporter substrate-binding/OmpA family protein [Psychromonas antarctica]|uniref:phosphate ABC transporter substrate-binding/OmpA family protein n=1 Tax=Psychromonas antarctica TaxID=67573 RepID=UPI001EE91DB1|nr:phosphate ABC transporter substrate-binding/OmpA family protein [Psychromonas antarctica]MCG6199891.1 phosphate ABC transporter substrate-binding/OmpA family protein [Psychromonas antarctica]
MSEQTGHLNLNPQFKKQLGLLQATAKSEFNIHISLDKMAQDKQYRETVLNELSELGNETLNEQVHLLRRVRIYLKSAPSSLVLDSLPSPVPSNGKKDCQFNLLAFFFLLFVCLSAIAAWQNGYLYISLSQCPITDPPLLIADKQARFITETVIATPTIREITTPAMSKKTLTLPSEDRTISLRLHGSNTIGENLAPVLLENYLKSQGILDMLWIKGSEQAERELQYIKDGHIYAIELLAHGSSTGFKDIINGQADMAMSSRRIKNKEVQLLRPLYGDLGLSAQEYIIGLDGLAVIVNPNNPITHLTNEILAKIFSGKIVNWIDLGGPDLTINVYARDQNSGTWDTFKNLVLKANGQQLISSARRYESSSKLSEKVAKDPGAIGFIGLPYVNNSKALAIAASDTTIPIYPTRFTISTEDYPLSRRLYVYAPSVGNKMVKEFAHFITSHAGQEIVEQIGLISQNIKLETIYKIKNAPQVYNDYSGVAKRLSVNFRFESSRNELDNKGKRDLLRLIEYMADNPGRRIVLMGFSDSLGDPEKNKNLSLLRASVVEQALIERGINVIAVEGFGEQLPIASNHNALGRSKNRRVEVWFF